MKYCYLYLLTFFLLTACTEQERTTVVASSSWTAAYIRAAGISEVDILAPSDMQHPSEYELNIDDIKKLRNTDLIVCGGYEIMMEKIRTGLNIDSGKIVQIKTDYNLEHIRSSIRTIAAKMGTENIATKHIEEIERVFNASKERIRQAGIDQHPVLVQFFIQPIARELDLDVADIFGPRPLEVFDIRDLMNQNFSLILDNAHNPVSAPLVETRPGIKVVYLINFPGKDGTESLADVIQYNVDRILEAAGDDN